MQVHIYILYIFIIMKIKKNKKRNKKKKEKKSKKNLAGTVINKIRKMIANKMTKTYDLTLKNLAMKINDNIKVTYVNDDNYMHIT